MEMLFVIGMLFFIFLFLLGFIFTKSKDIQTSERIVDTKNECVTFSNVIMAVFLSGNGTYLERSLAYNMTFRPSQRLLSVDNDFVTCAVPINQVSDNTLVKGVVAIENKNSMVVMKNV